MKKRKLCIVLCAVLACSLCASVLFGCGGGVKVGSKDNADSNVLTVGITGDVGEKNTVNALKPQFESMYRQKTGKSIKVKTVNLGSNYFGDIQRLSNAKNLPNVVQVYDYASEFLTANNILVSISDRMQSDGVRESDIVPSVLSFMKSGGTGDDKVYWMARDYNRVTVMYNKKIFDAAQVAYPQNGWKWSDFLTTCAALKAKESAVKAVTKQRNFTPVNANLNFEAVYYPAIRSYGGDLYDTATGAAFKNEAGVKAGLGKLYDLVDKGYASKPTDGGSFSVGEVAMFFCVRPNIVSAVSYLTENKNTPIDFVTMPSFDDTDVTYVGMGCTGYGISSQCPEEKTDLAWEFLKFVQSKQGQELLSATGSLFPMRKDMLNTNAKFNDYVSTADHSAFYTDPEGSTNRDLAMNFLQGFKVSKHSAIYNNVVKNNLFSTLCSKDNGDGFYSDLRNRLNAAIA